MKIKENNCVSFIPSLQATAITCISTIDNDTSDGVCWGSGSTPSHKV